MNKTQQAISLREIAKAFELADIVIRAGTYTADTAATEPAWAISAAAGGNYKFSFVKGDYRIRRADQWAMVPTDGSNHRYFAYGPSREDVASALDAESIEKAVGELASAYAGKAGGQ